jgi:hypothetical protein
MQGDHEGEATKTGTREEEVPQEGICLQELVTGCIIDDKGREKGKNISFIDPRIHVTLTTYALISSCICTVTHGTTMEVDDQGEATNTGTQEGEVSQEGIAFKTWSQGV